MQGPACEDGSACVGTSCSCFVELAVGASHLCARDVTGAVRCWGRNDHGQAGPLDLPPPAAIPLAEIEEIRAAPGGYHTCARTTGGDALCWGRNALGELGNGDRADSDLPVMPLGMSDVSHVGTGANHTCAIRGGGEVWCWGDNAFFQLGVDDRPDSAQPIQVEGLPPVVELALGVEHTCARASSGQVYCWGHNGLLQLGTEEVTPPSAAPIPSIDDAQSLVSGGYHTCADRADGRVWCWGLALLGQLGSPARAPPHVNVAPPGPVDLAQGVPVAAGLNHTCALDGEGDLYCWGASERGQIGDGTIGTFVSEPRRVADVSRASLRVGSGDAFTCALASGALWCWGDNAFGQLLVEAVINSAPLQVPVSCP